MKRMHSSGVRDLRKALRSAIEAYNSSIHTTTGFSPLEAEQPENFSSVYLSIEKKRYDQKEKYLKEYQRLNNTFKVNELVRRRLPKLPFSKEATERFSAEIYRISSIKLTEPLYSYELSELESDIALPGTYTVFDLIPDRHG